MLQEINLYQLKKTTSQDFLSFKQILQIAGGFAALLVLISIVIIYRQHSINMQLENLTQQQNLLNQNLDVEKNKLPTDQEKAKLSQEVTKLEGLNLIREKMFTVLNKIQYQVQPGFSGYFTALMQYTIDGVWFTKLQFADGGESLLLEGKMTAAENLPKLLQNLGKDPFFSGKKFEAVKLNADEKKKGVFTFTVQTQL